MCFESNLGEEGLLWEKFGRITVILRGPRVKNNYFMRNLTD